MWAIAQVCRRMYTHTLILLILPPWLFIAYPMQWICSLHINKMVKLLPYIKSLFSFSIRLMSLEMQISQAPSTSKEWILYFRRIFPTLEACIWRLSCTGGLLSSWACVSLDLTYSSESGRSWHRFQKHRLRGGCGFTQRSAYRTTRARGRTKHQLGPRYSDP